MTEYNKRGGSNYKAKGGKSSFGGSRGSGSSFGKKNWGDRNSSDRPAMFHKATCAKCSKACEVPFRPTGGKPVYCKDCFGASGAGFEKNRFPRKDFSLRAEFSPRNERDTSNDAVLKQIEILNTKVDQLLREVKALTK